MSKLGRAVEELWNRELFLPDDVLQGARMGDFLKANSQRELESEADRVGIAIVCYAGYNPDGASAYFKKVIGKYGHNIPDTYNDHPASLSRINVVTSELQRLRNEVGLSCAPH
jgi:predicted Zn-dependent protease